MATAVRHAFFGAAFAFGLMGSSAWAGSTLHIGPGQGTACAIGGCPLYLNEVNAIGATELDIYLNSGGAGPLVDPVLLILGVPNDTASGLLTSAGKDTLTSVNLYAPYPGGSPTAVPWAFGSSSFGLNGSGFQGLMTSGDVYSKLGLTKANNSNNFGNWSDWDQQVNSITATNFGIYVFALDTDAFAGKDLIDIGLTGVPLGTFAVAYGEDDKGNAFDTPFTEAGLETHSPPTRVPEPAALGLLGTGLAGLGLIRRRKRT